MTNDPMLEKWIEENCEYLPDGKTWAVPVKELEEFMAGKRIVEDVPVAWRHLGPRLSHGYHYRGDAPPDSLAAEWQPLYAAPSDTEVNNNG